MCLLVNFTCFESRKYSFLSGGSGSEPPYVLKKKNYLFELEPNLHTCKVSLDSLAATACEAHLSPVFKGP